MYLDRFYTAVYPDRGRLWGDPDRDLGSVRNDVRWFSANRRGPSWASTCCRPGEPGWFCDASRRVDGRRGRPGIGSVEALPDRLQLARNMGKRMKAVVSRGLVQNPLGPVPIETASTSRIAGLREPRPRRGPPASYEEAEAPKKPCLIVKQVIQCRRLHTFFGDARAGSPAAFASKGRARRVFAKSAPHDLTRRAEGKRCRRVLPPKVLGFSSIWATRMIFMYVLFSYRLHSARGGVVAAWNLQCKGSVRSSVSRIVAFTLAAQQSFSTCDHCC